MINNSLRGYDLLDEDLIHDATFEMNQMTLALFTSKRYKRISVGQFFFGR